MYLPKVDICLVQKLASQLNLIFNGAQDSDSISGSSNCCIWRAIWQMNYRSNLTITETQSYKYCMQFWQWVKPKLFLHCSMCYICTNKCCGCNEAMRHFKLWRWQFFKHATNLEHELLILLRDLNVQNSYQLFAEKQWIVSVVGRSPGNEVLHVLQLAAQLYGPLQLVLQTLLEITGDTLHRKRTTKTWVPVYSSPLSPIFYLAVSAHFARFTMHSFCSACSINSTVSRMFGYERGTESQSGNGGRKSNYLQLFY